MNVTNVQTYRRSDWTIRSISARKPIFILDLQINNTNAEKPSSIIRLYVCTIRLRTHVAAIVRINSDILNSEERRGNGIHRTANSA